MLPSLVRKTLRDYRRAMIGWMVGVAVFTAGYLSFWAQFRGDPEVARSSAETVPEGMRTALGWQDYATGTGYMEAVIFSVFVPLLLIIAAVTLGTRGVAGPEDRGVLDLLLANPIGRRAFVAQRFAALAATLVLIAAVPWLLTVIISQALDMGVSAANVSATAAGLMLLCVLFGTVALAVGAATGRRALTLATTGVIAVGAFVVRALGANVEWIRPLRWLSPFHYYLGSDPLRTGFHAGYLVVLATASVILLLYAAWAFERRDVGV